jgi:hypothetical protein
MRARLAVECQAQGELSEKGSDNCKTHPIQATPCESQEKRTKQSSWQHLGELVLTGKLSLPGAITVI